MSTVKDLISFNEMNQMLNAYNKNTKQSNSVFIEIAKLRDYLDYVEAESNRKSIAVSGIRFHFVANAENQTTIALSPTYQDKNDSSNMPHISFDPKYSQKGQPAILSDLLKNKSKANHISSIQNKNYPCPTNCPKK